MTKRYDQCTDLEKRGNQRREKGIEKESRPASYQTRRDKILYPSMMAVAYPEEEDYLSPWTRRRLRDV
eukprot:scaffold32463_cov221-Amphora_coffeaeformis.AAC.2